MVKVALAAFVVWRGLTLIRNSLPDGCDSTLVVNSELDEETSKLC